MSKDINIIDLAKKLDLFYNIGVKGENAML